MDPPTQLFHSQPPTEESQVLAVPPPLDANALRVSILVKLDQYLTLHATNANKHGSLDVSDPANHNTIRFHIVQKALLREIQQLSRLTLSLEQQLLARRQRMWLVHTSLALVSHVLIVQMVPILMAPMLRPWRHCLKPGQHRHNSLRIPPILFSMLQWSGYPIAIYSIVTSEKRIKETTDLQQGLSQMEMAIEEGAKVKNASCLLAESWQYIPWDSLKDWQ